MKSFSHRFVVLLACALLAGVLSAETGELLINPANPLQGWTFDAGRLGAKGGLAIDTDADAQRKPALRLDANFSEGGSLVWMTRETPPVETDILSYWVKVPKGRSQMNLRLMDATEQIHQFNLKLNDNGEWQLVILPLARYFENPAEYEWLVRRYDYRDGANDGVWHNPVRSVSFACGSSQLDSTAKGSLSFSDIKLVPPKKLPANTNPTPPLEIDGFWGIPFGTSMSEAKRMMLQKGGVVFADSEKDLLMFTVEKFLGQPALTAFLYFNNDRFNYGKVSLFPSPNDGINSDLVLKTFYTLLIDLGDTYKTLPTEYNRFFDPPYQEGTKNEVEAIQSGKARFFAKWDFQSQRITLTACAFEGVLGRKGVQVDIIYAGEVVKNNAEPSANNQKPQLVFGPRAEMDGFWGIPFGTSMAEAKRMMLQKNGAVFEQNTSDYKTLYFRINNFAGYSANRAMLSFHNDSLYKGGVRLELGARHALKKDLAAKYSKPTSDSLFIASWDFMRKDGNKNCINLFTTVTSDFDFIFYIDEEINGRVRQIEENQKENQQQMRRSTYSNEL